MVISAHNYPRDIYQTLSQYLLSTKELASVQTKGLSSTHINFSLSGDWKRGFWLGSRSKRDTQESENGLLRRREKVACHKLDGLNVCFRSYVLSKSQTNCRDLRRSEWVQRMPCRRRHGGGEENVVSITFKQRQIPVRLSVAEGKNVCLSPRGLRDPTRVPVTAPSPSSPFAPK
jgi:hypothetical protein